MCLPSEPEKQSSSSASRSIVGLGVLMVFACLGAPVIVGALGALGLGVLAGAGGAIAALVLCAAVPAVAAHRRASSRGSQRSLPASTTGTPSSASRSSRSA